jgi:hypothetical protein
MTQHTHTAYQLKTQHRDINVCNQRRCFYVRLSVCGSHESQQNKDKILKFWKLFSGVRLKDTAASCVAGVTSTCLSLRNLAGSWIFGTMKERNCCVRIQAFDSTFQTNQLQPHLGHKMDTVDYSKTYSNIYHTT